MRKVNEGLGSITRAMMLSVAMPLAFDPGQPGWKMDGDKLALDTNGNPIYINSAGEEQSVKGDTIANLNAEAKSHRTAKEAADAELAKYTVNGKRLDPTEASKAIETVKNIDAKKLIDAGEVDKVREQLRGEFTAQLSEKDAALGEATTRINGMMIDRIFEGSEFVRDNIAVPLDMFKDSMAKHFKIEEGKAVAYDRDGNRLMSKKSAGEYADAAEALELLVDRHPQKDSILRAPPAGGSGNNGGGGGRGGSNVIKRAAYDAMNPNERAQIGAKLGSGEMQLVD